MRGRSHFAAGEKLRLLFCGRHFEHGIRLTRLELASERFECLSCDPEDVNVAVKDAHILLPFMCPITTDTISNAPHLQCIVQYGVGLEGVDIAEASRQGVYVSNTPCRGNAEATAEHAMYLLLSAFRRPHDASATFQAQSLGNPLVSQMYGKNIMIVGFGNVGSALLQRLVPFQPSSVTLVKASTWDANQICELEKLPIQVHTELQSSMQRHMPIADAIILCCPLNNSTRGLVDENFCASVKSGCVLVNVARGLMVKYSAISDALATEKIGFFASDVGCASAFDPDCTGLAEPFCPDDALALSPNTLFTPHNGGVADHSYANMAKIVADAARRIYVGQPPEIWINQPFEEYARR